MAGNSVIGALRVHLGLDTAQFNEGLKSSKAGLGHWAQTAKVGAAAVATAMVAAGTAIGFAIKGMIDEADQMSKMSQQIGIPIDDLSRLKHAADLSDVSLEQLGKGVKRLSAAMLDIAQGGTGPAAKAFEMLGVKAQDANGALRPSTEVIADLSTKFAAMDDGATKTALAMQIFGKSGADLIPMLNSGGEGLREMYAEAEELGLVLDERTGKAAEAFNDNLTRLGKVKDGIIQKIGAGMLPALESLSAALVASSKNSKLMEVVGNALGFTLKALVSTAVIVGAAFMGVASDIGAAYDAASRFVKFDFKGGAEAWAKGRGRTQEIINGAVSFNKTLMANVPAASASAKASRTAGIAIEDLSAKSKKAARSTKELTEAEKELKSAKEEGLRLTERMQTPLERYNARVEELRRLLRLAAIDQETFNRSMIDARQAFEATDDPIGKLIEAGEKKDREEKEDDAADQKKAEADEKARREKDMKDATYDGIRGGLHAAADGNLGEYLASRLRESIFDGIANALSQAMSAGGGGGWSGLLNAGASVLSKIPGFATGGSFKVGGSGAADSKLVSMRLSPGEMVNVHKGEPAARESAVRVVVVPNDDRFDAYVDQRAAPMAARAYSAAVDEAGRQAPGRVAQAQRQGQ